MTAVDEAGGREALEAAGKGNGVDEHRVSSESPGRGRGPLRSVCGGISTGTADPGGSGGQSLQEKENVARRGQRNHGLRRSSATDPVASVIAETLNPGPFVSQQRCFWSWEKRGNIVK